MTKYKYVLMYRNVVVIRTNDIEAAREGVRFLGHRAYIQYTEAGMETYQEEKMEVSNV